ncbi:hypothetical protein ACJMK2_037888 [Sinanodonta woodiana]|uniref:ubiquitinyl hydrolase 1 n=1 Tax=Sinanodonta woodiana TaxID=1069815 RepID=A0ABD3WN90_SINWO
MAAEGDKFVYDPERNYDDATMAQIRVMENEIASQNNIVSDRLSLQTLMEEYADADDAFKLKIKDLESRYRYMRRTRGDGNCFYRAFGFACLEQFLTDSKTLPRFKEVAQKSRDELVSLGFPQFTIEDFHESFMAAIKQVEKQCSVTELSNIFNDQGLSDYIVVYLRLLVSGYLQKEADFFANFIEGERTVKEFCNQEVEPMGKESDHIHIIALTTTLDVPVRVEYMDRVDSEKCTQHNFPEESQPSIALLYRPGHYDILYS